VSRDGGRYELDAGSAGRDAAERLPSFNDNYTGAAPDMGAHEAGTPPLEFGVNADREKPDQS
jgi:hypothetical protein